MGEHPRPQWPDRVKLLGMALGIRLTPGDYPIHEDSDVLDRMRAAAGRICASRDGAISERDRHRAVLRDVLSDLECGRPVDGEYNLGVHPVWQLVREAMVRHGVDPEAL